MFQINLSENKWKDIEQKIPSEIFDIQKRSHNIPIEMITMRDSMKKNGQSNIDVAIICFRDACDMACDAIHALGYAHAALIWFYEEHPNAPLKYEAAHYGKFYTTDVALRLYSAQEHIANFIIKYLEIPSDEFERYQERFTSTRRQVSEYLIDNEPNHKITIAAQDLAKGKVWYDAMKYRNDWVHNQPQLIANTGIRLKRESVVQEEDGTYSIPLGKYEEPKYTIEELLSLVTEASNQFVKFMAELSNILTEYIETLATPG